MKVEGPKDGYTLNYHGKIVRVPGDKDRQELAKKIDLNKDGFLSKEEIRNYMIKDEIIKTAALRSKDGKPVVDADIKGIEEDFVSYLAGKELKGKELVRDYQGLTNVMKDLVKKYPKLAKMESIGKSWEKRDIWVLRITSPKNKSGQPVKPRIVLTGLHHAREWQTGEAAVYTAEKLLAGYGKDPLITELLDKFEVDIIPMVNPDGYEYSLKRNPWWRKNRRPNEDGSFGVDPNRNYYDERYPYLYRRPGDTPNSTWDDYGASDYPGSETYRGPSGASEPEIQAVQKFSRHPAVKAVIDLHSYGRMILFPWGHSYKPTSIDKIYKDMGNYMNKAVGNRFRVMQSSDLYPTTGSSEDWQFVQGHITYTIELGRRFQPSTREELLTDMKDAYKAFVAFMDYLNKHPELLQGNFDYTPPEEHSIKAQWRVSSN